MTADLEKLAREIEGLASHIDADVYDECWEIKETPQGKLLRQAAAALREVSALKAAMQGALEEAFEAGFEHSAEGFNGEYCRRRDAIPVAAKEYAARALATGEKP